MIEYSEQIKQVTEGIYDTLARYDDTGNERTLAIAQTEAMIQIVLQLSRIAESIECLEGVKRTHG